MSEPRVMAMMLHADRPQFIERAVSSFKAQNYENKALLIYDSGKEPIPAAQFAYNGILSGHDAQGIYYEYHPEDRGLTIGALRNLAMAFAHPLCLNADIMAHFDVDDVSHPNRITEQVSLLQASGADCVGYNEALFWKSAYSIAHNDDGDEIGKLFEDDEMGETWLYSLPRSNYALGTSLCYWRRTWEKKPFQDTNAGEDLRFIEGLNVKSVSGLPIVGNGAIANCEPRHVASVHGSNTALRIDDRSEQWRRVPEWDEQLRTVMALEPPVSILRP